MGDLIMLGNFRNTNDNDGDKDHGDSDFKKNRVIINSSDSLTEALDKAYILGGLSVDLKDIKSVEQLDTYILSKIMDKLIKEKAISPGKFLSGQHVGLVISRLMVGKLKVFMHYIDIIREKDAKNERFDYSLMGNLYLAKYVFGYDRKKTELLDRDEYLDMAVGAYFTAYRGTANETMYHLSGELPELDEILGLKNFIDTNFKSPLRIIGQNT